MNSPVSYKLAFPPSPRGGSSSSPSVLMETRHLLHLRLHSPSRNTLLLLFFFFFFQFPCSPVHAHPPPSATYAAIESDSQALLNIKRQLIDIRGALHSWNSSSPCSGGWAGIKCSRGQVVSIQLPWKTLAGSVSEKIGLLTSLTRISLHDNLLTGPLPTSLGSLPNLRAVYLFNNRLSGSIPPSIGNSLSLRILDLSNNFVSGSIPPLLASNSSRLSRLNLSFNSFSESIPRELIRLPSITVLALDHNNLSGSIPDGWEPNGNSSYYQLRILTLGYNLISGVIPRTIENLGSLEVLDLSHNMIKGNVPPQIGRLSTLRELDLSFNLINGSLPTDVLTNLTSLEAIKLKNNSLQGDFPSGLANTSAIREIDLSYNNFSGKIPTSLGGLHNLTKFDVSYNNLSGTVPPLLSEKFGSVAFVGNLQLCGFRGSTPCPSTSTGSPPFQLPNVQKHHGHHGLSTKDIILIAAGALLFVLLLLCCFLLCCLFRKRTGQKKQMAAAAAKPAKATEISEKSAPVSGESGGKLVHFDGPFVFTADDLLCATAEIMGKSAYGTAYKATLEDGNQVAVKRLREKATKAQKEFESEAGALGRIRHPNLVALRAYYLGPKGEKLLVFDYMPKGSLASFLHARGPETTIGWSTRMQIAMDVAHGLRHLHTKEDMVHGDLNSTNILLDNDGTARIADYGLSRLTTAAATATTVATAGALGYTAPEVGRTKKGTAKSDVYSLGVVMLELLTGKSPSEGGTGAGEEGEGGRAGAGEELPRWVASVVKEEWTNEVFDLELLREGGEGEEGGGIADELLNTLKLALHCVDPSPSSRPDAEEVLRQLQEIKPPPTEMETEEEKHDQPQQPSPSAAAS